VQLDFARRTLPLRAPLAASYGTLTERELIAVSLTDADGVTGHGEAAPLAAYDGVTLERVERALERYRPILASAGAMNGADILDACRRADELPQALAAIDLALWDRAGRRAGRPVCELIVEGPAPAVQVNASIWELERGQAARAAAAAAQDGYSCLKLKVGVGDDAGRVAAVRVAAGSQMALRLDANGAWTVEQAVGAIEALSPVGLELVEEPVRGLAGMREVRARVATRVAIDETAAEHGALTAGVADAICLKISRCGGITGLLAAAALVRASGAEPYLASTLDGPLGVAAALHAAAALAARGPLPPCGLATLGLFDGVDGALRPRMGEIAVPTGAGLGVEPL
jgi:L-Ala-D/L-Glu epimerase